MDVQPIAAPVAGKDYPRNWSEFLDWFASEEACLGYLEKLRWPGGFVCPACGVADDPYRSSRFRLMCRSCSQRTDGSAAYRSLNKLGFEHNRQVMLGAESPAHVTMPGVHRVASLVKRWILGTHHGSVQPGHLDAYLDEFVFRFNRRTSTSRGMLFYRLMQQAVVTGPVTYQNVVEGLPSPPPSE